MNRGVAVNIVSLVFFGALTIGVGYSLYALKKKSGNKTVVIPTNQKVVSVSFHEGRPFYLTRSMTECDSATTYQLIKFDRYQEIEKVVTVVESKD